MRLAVIAAVVLVVILVVPIVLLTAGGDDDPSPLSPPGAQRLDPGAIADAAQRLFRQPVVVEGEVAAVGAEGRFALRGGGGSILVDPEPGLDAVEAGDTVEVSGVVNRVSRVQADDIGAIDTVRTEAGAPFVSADALRPAG